MDSFTYIGLYAKGNQYSARLYGDKIISEQAGFTIHRSQITKYKIKYLKKLIEVFTGTQKFTLDYSPIIADWFDPLRTVRHTVIAIFALLPILFSAIMLNLKFMLPSVLFSVLSALLATLFFRLDRKNLLEAPEASPFVRLFLFALLFCLPVMYWYPFTVYIFATAAAISIFLGTLNHFFSSAIKIKKYYFSLAWLVSLIFFYFWFIAILSFWSNFQTFYNKKGLLEISQTVDSLSCGDITWKKPEGWTAKPYHFFPNVLLRKPLIWQILPVPIQFGLSTLDDPNFGWVTASSAPPQNITLLINTYLEQQKKILPSKFIQGKDAQQIPFGKEEITHQYFLYYDIVLHKPVSINLLTVPLHYKNKTGSLVFAFNLPENVSLHFYLDLIKGGLTQKTAP